MNMTTSQPYVMIPNDLLIYVETSVKPTIGQSGLNSQLCKYKRVQIILIKPFAHSIIL